MSENLLSKIYIFPNIVAHCLPVTGCEEVNTDLSG